MSAAPPSSAPVQTVSAPGAVSWKRWPRLLALDSVAVALVWLAVFGKVTGGRVDRAEWWVLGAAVWLAYMADRLLDARMPPDGSPALLRERHRFAATHWKWLVPLMAAVAGGAAWAALFQLRVSVLRGGVTVALLVLAYFSMLFLSRTRDGSRLLLAPVSGALVLAFLLPPQGGYAPGVAGLAATQLTALWKALVTGLLLMLLWPGARGDGEREKERPSAPWVLPRKLAGGLLFAAGTAAAPHFHAFQDWTRLLHGAPVLFFGGCCAMNSLGIRLWENPALSTREHRLLTRFYPWLTGMLAAAAAAQCVVADPYAAPALGACALSAATFTGLHLWRDKLSASLLSALADGVLVLTGAAALLLFP